MLYRVKMIKKSNFEKNLQREFKEDGGRRKEIIQTALKQIQSKKGRLIAWELFMKFYSPSDITSKIYHDQSNRWCEDYNVSSYEHMTIYRSMALWRVCGFLDIQLKDKPKNRFDKDYKLNPSFFFYYLEFNFNISLNDVERECLIKLFENEKLKQFLYDLYSYKDLNLNRNYGINFRYDLCRTFIKLLAGFMQSRVNHKFETADASYEIQTYNPKLMKTWIKIDKILYKLEKKYGDQKPSFTIYKQISDYWDKNNIY